MVEVKDDWCKGCNLCIINCPRKALTVSVRFNKRGIHPPEMADNHTCNSCRMCELVCPDFAITVYDKKIIALPASHLQSGATQSGAMKGSGT